MTLRINQKSPSGSTSGEVFLDETIFGIEPNMAVMHQVVTAQLARIRSGTHATKTRAMVSGGGAKPWRQKGTGRARQGSTRAPHWEGGGVAHGPQPRSYAQRTPKKMMALALRSALSDRAHDGRVVVVGDWGFATPKTKDAKQALAAVGIADGADRVLVVLRAEDEVSWKSFRNLEGVHCIEPSELNTYDVLVNDWIVFTEATLDMATRRLSKREVAEPSRIAVSSEPVGSAATEVDEVADVAIESLTPDDEGADDATGEETSS